jgi:hypothetical protein
MPTRSIPAPLQAPRQAVIQSIQLACAALVSFIVLVAILSANNYKFIYGDTTRYWLLSFSLATPFDPFFLPAYSAVVFVARQLTQGLHASSTQVLLVLSGVFFVAGNVLFLNVLRIFRPSEAFAGSLLFLFFPFVGITTAIDPRADSMAMAFLLASLLMLYTRRPWGFCVMGIVALFTHKALWPFVGLTVAAGLYRRDLKYYHALALGAPVVLLWLLGITYHGRTGWILMSHLQVQMMGPQGALPLLDGIIGTFWLGGFKNLVKLIMVLALLLSSLFLSYYAGKARQLYALALLVPIALLCVILNRDEIWAVVRFGRIIVLPAFMVSSPLFDLWLRLKSNRAVVWTVLAFLIASQFAFVYRMIVS